MNEEFHTYIKKAQESEGQLSLSADERARLESTLRSYMAMKPIRAAQRAPTFSPTWFFSPRPVAVALVVALFASTAGVSYAAENALPGDILYPVKTNINEPVQGALAVGASAKAAWAASVAGARVQEAAALAAKGELSTSTQAALQQNFDAHADIAAQAIAEASSTPGSDSSAAVSFEAQLSEYENVLAQVGADKGQEVAPLIASVHAAREKIALAQAQGEGGPAVMAALATSGKDSAIAAKFGDAARADLNASASLANSSSDALSTSSAVAVAIQLDNASASVSNGEDALGNDAPQALGDFQQALTVTGKLGAFLQASAAIHQYTGLRVNEPVASSTTTSTSTRSGQRRRFAAPLNASSVSGSLQATSSQSEDVAQPSAAPDNSGDNSDTDNGSTQNEQTNINVSIGTPPTPAFVPTTNPLP